MKTTNKIYSNTLGLIFGAFMFAFCLSSCEDFFETTIDIEAPAAVPKLVINTFVNTGQDSINMYVGRNFPLSSNATLDFESINAEVTIENLTNGNIITVDKVPNLPNSQRPYNYTNPNIADDYFDRGQEYLFTVRDISGEFPTATSQVSFPSKSVIKNIEFDYEGGIREDGDKASSFEITFDDPAGEKNFYEIGIVTDYNPTRNSNRIEFVSTIDLAATKGYQDDYVLLTDESFDGEEKTIELKIYRWSTDNIKFHLIWRNVSEDYFRYSKTLKTQIDLGDNPFASVAPVYTNVENGLGIISLYQEQIIPAN